MTVFEDHNYRIAGSAEEEIGMYYVSPSQMTRFGGVMPIQERLELVGRAEKEHFLIIEDDYNSEFKYFLRSDSAENAEVLNLIEILNQDIAQTTKLFLQNSQVLENFL